MNILDDGSGADVGLSSAISSGKALAAAMQKQALSYMKLTMNQVLADAKKALTTQKAQAMASSTLPSGLSLDDLTATSVNNADVTDSVFNTDTTLNSSDNPDGSSSDGSSLSDVIDSAIGALPGLILLSRTPSNKLPTVGAVQSGRTGTTVLPASAVKKPVNWTMVIVVIAITAIVIALITHHEK